jgi:hypothetical protein
MSDGESNDVLEIAAEIEGVAGVKLKVGSGLPGLLARVLPKWTLKSEARLQIGRAVLSKIEAGVRLDDAEVLYVTEMIGEPEARLIRRKQVEARAVQVLEMQAAASPLLIADAALPAETTASGSAASTAEDWLNKFWDDAGVVTDEVLQEIYARLLVSEARNPGTCSVRTLRVLRYLDRPTAEDFARVAGLVLEQAWLPQAFDLLKSHGADYRLITNLVDAGLLAPLVPTAWNAGGDPAILRWGPKALWISKPGAGRVEIVALTNAGKELVRLAQGVTYDGAYIEAVAHWMKRKLNGCQIAWAPLPHSQWMGDSEELSWTEIE